jgi:5,10-methenyltetrahydrofolate synthetase
MWNHEFRIQTMPQTFSSKTAKTELRRKLLADRQGIAAEVRNDWDAALGKRLIAWWEAHRVATLGVYWPIRGEPDLRPVYELLSARGVRLALPEVVENDAPLVFIEWKPGDAMSKDGFGVAIPAEGNEIRPEALLIPCVGFNGQRYRLGYGGGFYDRTLAVSPRPLAIGIAYACARAEFEADGHDMALDAVLTEAQVAQGGS